MRLSSLTPSVLALLGFLALSAAPTLGASAAKAKKLPFHGKLQAVDTAADMITIEGKTPRVFHLTPTTKITDGAGAASSLAAAVVGEDVGGSYTKDTAGTLTLFSVRLGAKTGAKAATATGTAAAPAPVPVTAATSTPEPAPAPEPAPPVTPAPAATASAPAATTAVKGKKQRFSGTVVSVDAAAHTVVIHGKTDQTFTVTSMSKITDASKKATTLAGLTAGEKVSGSYTKSDDGAALTLATLKVAK